MGIFFEHPQVPPEVPEPDIVPLLGQSEGRGVVVRPGQDPGCAAVHQPVLQEHHVSGPNDPVDLQDVAVGGHHHVGLRGETGQGNEGSLGDNFVSYLTLKDGTFKNYE